MPDALRFQTTTVEQKLHQTATGAALERSWGLASALDMIAQTMAEAEMQILHLLAKCYSDSPSDWAKTGCEWPTDFASVELKQAA